MYMIICYNAFMRICLQTVPLIEAQLRKEAAGITALRERVERGDMEALQQLAGLTSQVRQRLPQLSQFCKQNEETEEGVGFLWPLVARLTRMVEGPAVSKINESYNEAPWKILRQKDIGKKTTASSRISVSPRKESSPVRSRVNKENRGAAINESKAVVKKQEGAISKQPSKSISKNRKIEKPESCPNEGRQEQPNKQNAMEISFNNGAMFLNGNTLLTVRLSKQQYAQVMRLKKQQGHQH